jgi:transposase
VLDPSMLGPSMLTPLMLTPLMHGDGRAHVAPAVEVFIVLEAVDMRVGIEGLSMLVERSLGRSPCAGSAYAFSNKPRNRIKLLQWDGTGVWLATRRLHEGRFVWPRLGGVDKLRDNPSAATASEFESESKSALVIDQATWQWLVSGVDWRRVNAKVTDHARWRVG